MGPPWSLLSAFGVRRVPVGACLNPCLEGPAASLALVALPLIDAYSRYLACCLERAGEHP